MNIQILRRNYEALPRGRGLISISCVFPAALMTNDKEPATAAAPAFYSFHHQTSPRRRGERGGSGGREQRKACSLFFVRWNVTHSLN